MRIDIEGELEDQVRVAAAAQRLSATEYVRRAVEKQTYADRAPEMLAQLPKEES